MEILNHVDLSGRLFQQNRSSRESRFSYDGRERAPTWVRRDYWEGMRNIWAAERWQETSTTMKVNRAANPEANKHTSGSVSFATHQSRLVFDKTHKKKGTDQYISDRAREVAESYSQQMTEKYAGEEEHPQLDPEV
ncbi:hypothetical protein Taro_046921 [Colocasia esculenta]|uniref:Uncharacterized protein n=1 Tax=Colocasia esculenta TaxID=4460 RepID=A0A843WRC5_COLES|nr:hypothetical protein [Colocasia esculenta]